MNTEKGNYQITKLTDGYYVELNGFGKSFAVGESYDWNKCLLLAESWADYIRIFTDPERSLIEWQKTFQTLNKIVQEVREEFPIEGSEGFSDGDFTFFANLSEMKIGVQFGNLNVYLLKSGEFAVEMITNFYPKRTTIVCSGVSAEVVVQILKTSPRSRGYVDPIFKQLYFSESNLKYFNSVRSVD
jgi:hypothetical protein